MEYFAILDITLQFGDSYPEGGGDSWWLQLLNTIIGAAIGTGATIWALFKTFRNDKKKEENNRLSFQKEKIKYLQSLMRSIDESLKQQIAHLHVYAETITKDPVELPLLHTIPLNELTQVVHKLNLEEYYHAYLGEFGDNQTVIDEFRDLISFLNYFDSTIALINKTLEKAFEADHDRKAGLTDILEKTMDEVGVMLFNTNVSPAYQDLWMNLVDVFARFMDRKATRSDLRMHVDHLIVPFRDALLDVAAVFRPAHQMLVQFKNIIKRFDIIQEHNIDLAADFEKWHTDMGKNYIDFQKISARLTAYPRQLPKSTTATQ